ncbi:MAG: WxcM-like domain-containing protein [Nanoarchaeota archaeon]
MVIYRDFKQFKDLDGSLIPFEFEDLPFKPQRIFIVKDVPKDIERGNHAHYMTRQLLVCLEGKILVKMYNGIENEETIIKPMESVLVNSLVWDSQIFLTDKDMLLSLCSTHYMPKDYIDNINIFNNIFKRKIAIVVAAYCLHGDIITNFIEWNKKILQEFDVELIVVSDRFIHFENPKYRSLVYPRKHKPMSRSRILNYGIKNAKHKDIIYAFDIDVAISRQALVQSLGLVNYGVGVSFQVGRINTIEESFTFDWNKLEKRITGYGMMGMNYSDWDKLNGYDERMCGWGYEDVDLWRRSCKTMIMHRLSDYPIYHIDHPDRSTTGSLFENRNSINGLLSDRGGWECKNWGEDFRINEDYAVEF